MRTPDRRGARPYVAPRLRATPNGGVFLFLITLQPLATCAKL